MEKHILTLESSGYKGDISLEDQALELTIDEIYQANGNKWKPWAKNARSLRVGDIILIVDSDTVVPEVSKVPLPPVIPVTHLSSSITFINLNRTASEMQRVSWQSAPRLRSFNTNPVSAASCRCLRGGC
jgi:hypothetical protein